MFNFWPCSGRSVEVKECSDYSKVKLQCIDIHIKHLSTWHKIRVFKELGIENAILQYFINKSFHLIRESAGLVNSLFKGLISR